MIESPAIYRKHEKVNLEDLTINQPIELVVLSVKDRGAQCCLLGTDKVLTLRTTGLWDIVPGEIVTVDPNKKWSYAGHPYLSGEIKSTRIDIKALHLVPLKLEDEDKWDPNDQYWGEPDEPINEYLHPMIARGPRPQFQMEQVLPGCDFENPFSDPIGESNDLKEMGHQWDAQKILMKLCQSDLRCLDAHSHLGNLIFDRRPEEAIRHYEIGVQIGELSLGKNFDGVLPWGMINNRPFLRCLQGKGICLWRLGKFKEAEEVLDQLLWFNPTDNQGVRFILPEVKTREAWKDDE